jgi:hypothetical protein
MPYKFSLKIIFNLLFHISVPQTINIFSISYEKSAFNDRCIPAK